MLVITALLLCAVGFGDASHFRGAYVSWTVNDTDPNFYPKNPSAANYKVHVNYGTSWRRSDGAPCTLSAIATCQQYNHGQWAVYYGTSKSSISNAISSFGMSYFCERFTSTYDFNTGSNVVTLTLPTTYVYKIITSSCCWVSDLTALADSSWNVEAIMEFGVNPATGKINRPPHIENLPVIEHNYYTTQTYVLPVYDFDGDEVKCRWAANSSEGGGVWNSRKGTLDRNRCSLTLTSGMSMGWFPLAVIIEDYARAPSGTLQLQSQIPLQFTVLIHTAGASLQGQNQTNCKPNYPSKCLFCSQSTLPPTTTKPTTPQAYKIDACSNYQVLINPDRLSTYNDWSSYRCDRELYGWYRFKAAAGNRMLDYCPNTVGNSYKCGSYYQGWIPSGGKPTTIQGVVPTTACFSMYGSCSCSYTRQIYIRNCGNFYVYWINGVPACNARYCGVKGGGKIVSCGRSNMKIELDRAQYNVSLYSSITLKDNSCYATITNSKILAGSTPGTCGATRRETASHIIYENVLTMKAKAIDGVVRDNDQKITFSCKYSTNGSVSLLGYKPIYTITDKADGYGNFTAAFQMYTDQTYGRVHSYYPVNAQLRDWLYLEIFANVIDNNIVVLVDECYATPTMNPMHPEKSVFIKNGCKHGQEFVTFHSAPNNKNRFSVQAIRFLQNSTAVYFHCRFYLCYETSSSQKCNQGCGYNTKTKNRNRGRRSVEQHSPSDYYTLNMEVRLKENIAVIPGKEEKGMNPVYIVGFGVGIVLLVAVVALLLIKMNRMKRSNQRAQRGEARGKGDNSGVDNKGLELS